MQPNSLVFVHTFDYLINLSSDYSFKIVAIDEDVYELTGSLTGKVLVDKNVICLTSKYYKVNNIPDDYLVILPIPKVKKELQFLKQIIDELTCLYFLPELSALNEIFTNLEYQIVRNYPIT